MKPFNEKTPCIKCGATGATAAYEDLSNACERPVFPKMRRTCKRCGYNWYELPLDAQDVGAYFDKKARHIESRDANAVCLCGEMLEYRGSGRFVCPKALPEEGAA